MSAEAPSYVAPSWIPPLNFFTSKKENTFQYDDSLPSLPIPPLSHTLKLYLESVLPVDSKEEYENTQKIVQEFENGVGKQLQERLMEKFKDSRNWLDKYWLNNTYLSWRESVVPFMQMAGISFMETLNPPLGDGRGIRYAAIHIYYSMQFWNCVRKGEVRVDVTSKGAKQTMHQLKSLFSNNRLPGETMDYVVSHFKLEVNGDSPTHMVVLCHGHMYILETVDESGDFYTPPELESQLRIIWDDAHAEGKGQEVGALVTDQRANYCKLRKHLKELDPQNAKNLTVLEEAVLSVILEDEPIPDAEESVRHALVGNVGNKWLEKSSSFIAWPNGRIISVADHTCMEGTASVLYAAYVCSGAHPHLQHGWIDNVPERPLPAPNRLHFKIDEEIEEAIQMNIDRCNMMHKSIGVSLLDENQVGKQMMKSWGVHPDALVQTALQLAYYKLHGKPAPTYETATTRMFYRARTETCRTCTSEAVEFCRAMCESSASKEEKIELLKKATQRHTQLMGLCTKNHGCDRHLLGLKLLAQEEGVPTPEIFLDPSWTKSGGDGNFVLSTSLAGYVPQRGGTTPMCLDGYGAFYCIMDHFINIMVVTWLDSKVSCASNYSNSIHWAFSAIKALSEPDSKL